MLYHGNRNPRLAHRRNAQDHVIDQEALKDDSSIIKHVEKQKKIEEAMDAIEWEQNIDPEEVWTVISEVSLMYNATSPIGEKERINWVTKHALSGYNQKIKMAMNSMKGSRS